MADTTWRHTAWYGVEGGGTLYLQLIGGNSQQLDKIGMYLQQSECPVRLKLVGTQEWPIRPPEETSTQALTGTAPKHPAMMS